MTTPLQHALVETRRIARAAAAELAEEAKTLGTRVEVEFLGAVGEARETGREQLSQLGVELVKLGHKLEKFAGTQKRISRRPAAKRPAHPAS